MVPSKVHPPGGPRKPRLTFAKLTGDWVLLRFVLLPARLVLMRIWRRYDKRSRWESLSRLQLPTETISTCRDRWLPALLAFHAVCGTIAKVGVANLGLWESTELLGFADPAAVFAQLCCDLIAFGDR